MDFLPGSFGYDGSRSLPPHQAALVLWLAAFTAVIEVEVIDSALAKVPDEWLEPTDTMPDVEALRTAYRLNLLARLDNPSAWLPCDNPS